MWILSWKKYALSRGATAVSILGAFVRYAGVFCFFEKEILAGIICIAVGIGIHYGAEYIAKNAASKLKGRKVAPAVRPTTVQQTARPVQTNSVQSAPKPAESAIKTVRCGQCGMIVTDDSKFCTRCGTIIAESRQKRCFRCGAPAEDGNKFCPFCGYEIK